MVLKESAETQEESQPIYEYMNNRNNKKRKTVNIRLIKFLCYYFDLISLPHIKVPLFSIRKPPA